MAKQIPVRVINGLRVRLGLGLEVEPGLGFKRQSGKANTGSCH